MGSRGPQPTPTAILAMRGSWRAKLNDGGVQPADGKPDCPRELSGAQKTVWRAVVNRLGRIPGLLSKIDAPLLTRYCVLTVRWTMVQAVVEKFSTADLIASAYGNDEARKILRLAQNEARQLHHDLLTIEAKFGMSPSDRARIRLDGSRDSPASDSNQGASRFFRREA